MLVLFCRVSPSGFFISTLYFAHFLNYPLINFHFISDKSE
ncbi:hypothetical protein HMPREF0201_01513 [Cedecea davisae DSM 4568]|uniref:Uncharacterized protein n=1 Tax=Cedecea davisae DSM 4568 TaxID=566551 RepID=S3JD59_9ENTR|nr:hypothetical protein HMPREF0201_01513 [Cedecea davisae DSM 4568]